MSVSKWAYEPDKCDGEFCVGECDLCSRRDYKVKYKELVEMIDEIYSREDAEEVYREIDKAETDGEITWWDHDTLTNITRKIAKTAW